MSPSILKETGKNYSGTNDSFNWHYIIIIIIIIIILRKMQLRKCVCGPTSSYCTIQRGKNLRYNLLLENLFI